MFLNSLHVALCAILAAPAIANVETCISTVIGLDNGEAIQIGAPSFISASAFGGIVFSSDSGGVYSILRILSSRVLQRVAGVPGYYDAALLPGSIASSAVVNVSSLVAVPDSTEIYFSDKTCVFKINDEGFIELIAGIPNDFGYSGDGGSATSARLNYPSGIAYSRSNIYISDTRNHVIRKVSVSSGIISTIAGNNIAGYSGDNSLATSAMLHFPNALAFSNSGDLFIADSGSKVIRKVNSSGYISTVAGNNKTSPLLDPSKNVLATQVAIAVGGWVQGQIALDTSSVVLYIVDSNNMVLSLNLSTGFINRAVGNGINAYKGDGSRADSNDVSLEPASVTVDATDALWIVDNTYNAIRFVEPKTKIISSFLLAVGTVNGTSNVVNGTKLASFAVALNYNEGVAISLDNTIFVTDTWNNAIYKMSIDNEMTLIAGKSGVSGYSGDGSTAANALLSFPIGIVFDETSRVVYFSDTKNNAIRSISTSGIISTLSGGGGNGFNDGPVKTALFSYPSGLALSQDGKKLYVADENNNVVRLISGIGDSSTATVSTFAGSRNLAVSSGDGGPATSAGIQVAGELSLCNNGQKLYIVDKSNKLRLVNTSTMIITTVIGNSTTTYSQTCGLGGNALSASVTIYSVACAPSTNQVYISGKCNDRGSIIAKLDSNGDLVLVAGNPLYSGYADSSFAITNGLIGDPKSISFSSDGALFISDMNNNVVRQLQLSSTKTLCPSGFFCSCGRNPTPCISPSTFCPVNSKNPLKVSDGYLSTTTVSPFEVDRGLLVYNRQISCPVGFYCSKGARIPCPGGTYGISPQQSAVQSCIACAAGTYLADTGVGSPSYQVSPPCKSCPIGSVSNSASSKFCTYCPPGNYSDGKNCISCPKGSFSFPGSSSCFASEATDGIRVQPQTMIFQRRREVTDNNKSAADVVVATLAVIIPVLFIFAIPYIIAIMARSHCFPHDINQFIIARLESIDLYSIRTPHSQGDSPKKLPTAHGGAMYILVVGMVLAPIISTYISYLLTNTLVVISLRPLTLPKLTSFQELPYTTATTFVDDASIRPLLTSTNVSGSASGFAILVKTMGAKCGEIKKFTPNLHSGEFSVSSEFSAATGRAEHAFRCPRCTLDELSTLTVDFDATCQSFSVTMSAVGVGGGISSSTMSLSPSRPDSVIEKATGTFLVSLEVIQDTIKGERPKANGLVLGGRSAMGLLLLAASGVSTTERQSYGDRMTLNLLLEQQGDFVQHDLIPIMSILQLLTAMSSWLPFIASGVTLLYVHEELVLRIWGAKALPHLQHLKNEAIAQAEGDRKERAIKAASISLAASGPMTDVMGSGGGGGGGGGSIHLIRRSVSAARVIQQFKMNALLKNPNHQEMPQISEDKALDHDDDKHEQEEVKEHGHEKDEVISVNKSIVVTSDVVSSPPRVSRFGFVKTTTSPLSSLPPT